MTYWGYVGCKSTDIPAEVLEKSEKLTKAEIKEIISSIPIEEGITEANSIDDLTKKLLINNIILLKVRKLQNEEIKLLKLKLIASSLNKKDEKIEKPKDINILTINQAKKSKPYSVARRVLLPAFVVLLLLFLVFCLLYLK